MPDEQCGTCGQPLPIGSKSCSLCTAEGNASPDLIETRTVSSSFPRIKGYRIMKWIGSGGMGDVYLGEDEILKRRVAIKVVSEKLLRESLSLDRFLREARSMATVEHPNVVRVYNFTQTGESFCLVMEYVDGEDLGKMILSSGRIPMDAALQILRQVVEALQSVWEKGIVHRDIKPSNILMDQKGNARVADFGLAKPQQISEDSRITRTGMVPGTPQYISPEQLQGEPADFRSDVYSLGILLFEMLSGKPPFTGPTPAAIFAHHLNTKIPNLLEEFPDIPLTLQQLLERMTSKLPADRPTYPEVLSMVDAVQKSPSRQGVTQRLTSVALASILVATSLVIVNNVVQHKPQNPAKSFSPAQSTKKESDPPKTFIIYPNLIREVNYTGKTISVDFQKTELADAFHEIANRSGLNVTVDPDVLGTTDLKLKAVPWDQAVEILCRENYLGNTLSGNILSIWPIADLFEESGFGPTKPVTVNYQNRDIGEVIADLNKLSGVNITAHPEVKAKITIQGHRIPWIIVLQSISEQQGWAMKIQKNAIFLAPPLHVNEKKAGETGPLSLEMDNIDVHEFFAFLSNMAGVNFLVDPDVTGKINVKVTEMRWEEIVPLVCKSNSLGYVIQGSNIRIARLAKLRLEEKESKYIPEIQHKPK